MRQHWLLNPGCAGVAAYLPNLTSLGHGHHLHSSDTPSVTLTPYQPTYSSLHPAVQESPSRGSPNVTIVLYRDRYVVPAVHGLSGEVLTGCLRRTCKGLART